MDDSLSVPTLCTERLVLRGFMPADLDALAALFADREVMRYIHGGVRTYYQAQANLRSYLREWDIQGYGVWAVARRDDDELLGTCGFVAHAELGYILSRAAWGRGYATEAARACLRFGFETVGFEEIGAGALAGNMASRHVIEKLGFRRAANPYFDHNGGVYYRLQRKNDPPGPGPHTDDGDAECGAPR